jgi:hypothetical protein
MRFSTILLMSSVIFAQTPVVITQGGNQAAVTVGNALKTDASATTQPVSAAALPLPSGAATSANQSTTNSTLSTISSQLPSALASGRLSVDGSGVTQPVSGTVAISGTVPVSGTFWQATQPVSIASMPTTPVTGTFWQETQPISGTVTVTDGAGALNVIVDSSALPSGASTLAEQQAQTTALQLIDDAVATTASTAPTKSVLAGVVGRDAQPTAVTNGQATGVAASLDGAVYIRYGGPVSWTCGLAAVGATLTQCQAAPGAGLKLYITDIITQSATTTSGLWTLRYGTGANCVTGTGNIFANSASATLANAASTLVSPVRSFSTPIAIPANNAVCVLGVATNTTNITISGFTAP